MPKLNGATVVFIIFLLIIGCSACSSNASDNFFNGLEQKTTELFARFN